MVAPIRVATTAHTSTPDVVARADFTDELRFVLLETLHEYARECLVESGASEAVQRRRAAYYLALHGSIPSSCCSVGAQC